MGETSVMTQRSFLVLAKSVCKIDTQPLSIMVSSASGLDKCYILL